MSLQRGKSLVARSGVLLAAMIAFAPALDAQDDATQVVFTIGHTDCGGDVRIECFIGSTSVAVVTPLAPACSCDTPARVVTISDPALLDLVGTTGCALFSLRISGSSMRPVFIRADITRSASGLTSHCLFDDGPGCSDRGVCSGATFR